MYPYKLIQVQQLMANDAKRRMQFASDALEKFGENFSEIFWIDESIFRLSAHVSSLNGPIWSTQPPNVFVEEPLHLQQVHVWMSFTSEFKLFRISARQ